MKPMRIDAALAGLARDARGLYDHDVEQMTTKLGKGLRSGKFRGWEPGDGDRFRDSVPPFLLLQDAVEAGYVRTPRRAALVLLASPSLKAAAELTEGSGKWKDCDALALAVSAMAIDIVAAAERRGYVPKPRASRRAA